MRRDLHFHPPFLWNDNAGGAAPSATPAAPSNPAPAAPAAPSVPTLPADALQGLQSLISRYGGSTDAVSTLLYNDNHDLRQKLSEAKKQLPAEGALVLSGDDVTAYQALTAALTELGLKPDQLKTEILQKRQIERDLRLVEVAKAKGWNLDALKAVQGIDGMSFEIKEEVDPNNPQAKVTKVLAKAGDGEAVAIETIPTIVPLLPALQQQVAPQPTGVPFITQPAGGAPPAPTDTVSAFLQNKEKQNSETPNLLMPHAPAPAR